MAMLLEKQFPGADKFLIKHGPAGHNLHTQWKAGAGPNYKSSVDRQQWPPEQQGLPGVERKDLEVDGEMRASPHFS